MDTRHTHIPARKLSTALIDDSESTYASLRSLLGAIGDHSVAYYTSPEAFNESARAEDFDCIFLDYMFPGDMDGIDMLRHLAGLDCQTPVIMVTGHDKADHFDAFEMGRLGAGALLLKPFVAARVKEALQKALLPRPAAPPPADPPPTAPPPAIPTLAAAGSVPIDWESGDLEDPHPLQLDAAGLAALRRRAQRKFNPSEYQGFAELTLRETQVFLFRAQYGNLSARDMAGAMGLTVTNLNAHIGNAAGKLGTSRVLDWRNRFDKLK